LTIVIVRGVPFGAWSLSLECQTPGRCQGNVGPFSSCCDSSAHPPRPPPQVSAACVAQNRSRAEREQTATYYLEVVGLGHAMHKYPAELSGGMRQRVGIARAFALNPKMLLLDEPFGMLDSLTRFELQDVLIDLWSQDQKTALMVTHDVDEALFLSDRMVMMTSGPAATIGEIVEIPFPRTRTAVLEHPQYYKLRERLVGFLEAQDHRKPPTTPTLPPSATPVPAETAAQQDMVAVLARS
jgi:nitrate/nitrite transport system ATP-binding protein